jgi:hypothetical protein
MVVSLTQHLAGLNYPTVQTVMDSAFSCHG